LENWQAEMRETGVSGMVPRDTQSLIKIRSGLRKICAVEAEDMRKICESTLKLLKKSNVLVMKMECCSWGWLLSFTRENCRWEEGGGVGFRG